MWVCCRDIDPGEVVKVPKERTFFNVAKTNGPRYRSTHVLVREGRNVRSVVQAQKARFTEISGLLLRFLRDVLASLRHAALRLPRLVPYTSGPRCPLSELLYAAFGVNGTFVTAAVIIGTADAQYV